MRVETRRLEYFLHIADAGSINRAAQHIGMAQPALSRQLAILENELQSILFERSASGIRLTAAGRALYVRAQIIVRQVASLRLDVGGDPRNLSGLVAVGMPPSHEQFIGVALIARAFQRYPKIRLQISSGSMLLEQLQHGTIDIALVAEQVDDAAIETLPLFREDMVLVQHAAAAPPPDSLEKLADLPWIVTRAQRALHGILGTIFSTSRVKPRIIAEINAMAMVMKAVEQGLGVTVLPLAALGPALSRGEISIWPIPGSAPCRTISLCRRQHGAAPSVTAISRLIQDLVEHEIRGGGRERPIISAPASHTGSA